MARFSASGLLEYDFSIRDSIRIRLPDRTIDVYEVRVRPKDDAQPRAIGAVYIDREEGQVVRMAFSFTRVALKDEQLDDVSVVLENALTGGRFWLPSRQEIEIRRSGTWLDYPARGIIRGRWEIGGYQLNQGFPERAFAGPEIVMAPRRDVQAYPWEGRVLDSLPPDVRATVEAIEAAPTAGLLRLAERRASLDIPLALATTDLDGNVFTFAFLTDKVKVPDTLDARAALEQLTAALAACRCSS